MARWLPHLVSPELRQGRRGGLYSTIDDLRKWDENFYTHQVGGDALQKLIHTRGILTTVTR
jgi:hypothetical protein